MTPPPELLGGLKRLPLIGPVLADNVRRRVLFAALVAICAALTLFPERYRAAVSLSPSDPSSLGLQGALGQLGAFNTVFGNQAAIEIALRIARSTAVRDKVATKLDLDKKLGTGTRTATSRWLAKQVDVRALRGGIVQMELKTDDPELGRAILGAWSDATRAQLAEIAVRQTEYKRSVLEKLVTEATTRMLTAQANYDRFRLNRRTAEPGQEIGAVSGRIEGLRQAIKGKDLQLRSALAFATPENFQIRQIQSERQALQAELSQALAQRGNARDTLGNVVTAGTELIFLERELAIARSLFDNYNRFLLGTYVEDLTSTANIRILEAPYVDTERQLNIIPLAIGALLLLIGLAFEMQLARRPVGRA
jgi:capsule polysaccharide export protein KpsE/RkpR